MSYVTGATIKELREKRRITQKELSDKIGVSDKTVSKWETSKGLPDIGIIEELARALGVSIAELLTGELRENGNQSANMRKMCFYVCPVCGNIITSVGHGAFSCCGIALPEAEAEKAEDDHRICIATVYKGNIIKNLIMDCQSYTKYRPNETTGGIFVSWRRKEELPMGA